MEIKLDAYKKSITSLEGAVLFLEKMQVSDKILEYELNTIKSGVIKNFEFVYEQSWKLMKRWLEQNVTPTCVDGVTRRELFRVSAQNKLINDVDLWMDFHGARNLTSHTYDEITAEDVLEIAVKLLPSAKELAKRLESIK